VPELPEVETIRRQLAARVPGHRVVAASAHPSPKFADATEVVGARILAVLRRGKYLLLPTDDDRELVIHLGMTGVLSIQRSATVADTRWRRASWELDDGSTLALDDQRRFGRVAVVPRGDHRSLPTLAALGPEPLEAGFTPAGLHRALAGGGQVVKTRLLGQRVVAGVGNIYADEALCRGPARRARRRAQRSGRTRRDAAARLPHPGRRHRRPPMAPRLLRPRRPAVQPLRHDAAPSGPRRAEHDLVPDLPGQVRRAALRHPAAQR
jgi:formamidopyrimidine-DNA glycosylase